jgi:hypothetical protein
MNAHTQLRAKIGSALLGCALTATCGAAPGNKNDHRHRMPPPDWAPGLVSQVVAAVSGYRDIRVAEQDGYVKGTECVSSNSSDGAMGVHYVRPDLLGDGVLDVAHPEALVYEPDGRGRLHLVAAEYITFAADWHRVNGEAATPSLVGQAFHFMNAPNRYALPALYELHVWAFTPNSNGMFANYNPHVSCVRYVPST